MKHITATTRIALTLAMLVLFLLQVATTCRLIPDQRDSVIKRRLTLCESVAITCSQHASRNEIQQAEELLEIVMQRNTDLISVGIRDMDGQLVLDVGDHQSLWQIAIEGEEGNTHCKVPIIRGKEDWGQVELCFRPVQQTGFVGWLQSPMLRLTVFMFVCCFLGNMIILRRTLQHLDPSKVVPERVRTALDTISNGLILVDPNERIVLANQAFADRIGSTPESLQGLLVSSLDWSTSPGEEDSPIDTTLPWQQSLKSGESRNGDTLNLRHTENDVDTFLVNSSPIMGNSEEIRGALVTFEDITELAKKKQELIQMLHVLRESREEISRKNKDLQYLATRDALTGCRNRRSLYVDFESLWEESRRENTPLSCIMLDVDHFKLVNDNHGHSKGDSVLKVIAKILDSSIGQDGIVGRFGGEEFCVLLPSQTIDDAQAAGERIRKAIEKARPGDLPITVSLGASAISLGAKDRQELLNEADKCLYIAKRNGRNQVVRWDQVPDDIEVDKSQVTRTPDTSKHENDSVEIPFHAVTALTSALGYRHTDTAQHCRRVADLAVKVASTMMSVHETYVLEISALLHDIGKIGVPDSILLKPGQLTDEEWAVMRDNDRIGVEIVRTTFECPELTDILKTHTAWYEGSPDNSSLPSGEEIPVSARILAIADAYDAMVSNHAYRKRMTQQEAFEELRRCAGKQFDPRLVERFVEVVLATDDSRRAETTNISRQTAFKIGQQIEGLANALDNHDMEGLRVLANRLAAMAHQSGVEAIADLANEVGQTLQNDPDLKTLIDLTLDLIEVCRSTQSVYLADVVDHAGVRMPK